MAQVQVPEILDIDATHGFMLLEDLGDVTLLRKLQEVNDVAVESELYKKVIDELVKMHVFASQDRSRSKLDAFHLKFDYDNVKRPYAAMIASTKRTTFTGMT